jgi:uncharacterized protein (TIGR02266 family)
MGNEGTDQRQSPRFRTRLFGVFRRDIDLDETEVLMLNLSLGGAFVKAEDPCPPGTPITLRFYLDDMGTPLSVAAEVAWWRRSGVNAHESGMGVRFLQVGDEDHRRLREYLARLIEEDLFGV